MSDTPKPIRTIFVIMPFVKVTGGDRNEERLTSFFENNIKKPIEAADDLQCRYEVSRSGQAFNITGEIIRELCRADIVIADLSGVEPNPNVMYELGLRLAIAERPVILIREAIGGSQKVFDIAGFYAHPYDPYDYAALEEHLLAKLARLESGEERFDNPISKLIREEEAIQNPDLSTLPPDRQRQLVVAGVNALAARIEAAYGPHGRGVTVGSGKHGPRLLHRATEIVSATTSSNPFENEGVRLVGHVANQVAAEVGDGAKLGILMAARLITEGEKAIHEGELPNTVVRGVEAGMDTALKLLGEELSVADFDPQDVARTAAKSEPPVDVVAALEAAGADGVIVISSDESTPSVKVSEGFEIDRGTISMRCFSSADGERADLEPCQILIHPRKIGTLKELLPVLESVAERGIPLLLIAEDVEGEALATIILNNDRGSVRCIPIKAPGHGDVKSLLLSDLAMWTGATVIDPSLGRVLESATTGDLGYAERVVVTADRTTLFGGAGDAAAIQARVEHLQRAVREGGDAWSQETLRQRIASLAGRRVTICPGGESASTRVRNRRRVEEALHSCAAAHRGGQVVPGGGQALLMASEALRSMQASSTVSAAGISAVAAALARPREVLVYNSGVKERPEVDSEEPHVGFDARTGKCVDLLEAGIVDPVEVITLACELAASAAKDFFQTGSWTP